MIFDLMYSTFLFFPVRKLSSSAGCFINRVLIVGVKQCDVEDKVPQVFVSVEDFIRQFHST